MSVLCVGISHRTAPVEVRERFVVGEATIPLALARLRESGHAEEGVWLSTCNRVELYLVADPGRAHHLREFLRVESGAQNCSPGDALYVLNEPESVEHLFRVASGLDSMVLGETEILGQLKRAYELARQHGHTGSLLNRTFQRAFNVAKQIRSETNIQRGGISVASVAVELAEHIFETVEDRRVLVIGAGDTGEKVARALVSRGAREVLISNRSPDRAQALADALGSQARAIGAWHEAASTVDVIVCSTSASEVLLNSPEVARLMTARGRRPLLLVDLAVPRNVDPSVISLSDVYLFNVDDLQAIADAHLRQREAEVARCRELIRQRAASFLGVSSLGGPPATARPRRSLPA